ncbi:MAG: patatin-like phospholipase family protein [Candidatus Melainabacteria bacterium]|nr:patatin-like phospholipase family protein [Candidatus Melainabacteria bacterium]
MSSKRKLRIALSTFALLSLASGQAFADTEKSSKSETLVPRSRDSHAFDEFPSFDKSQGDADAKDQREAAKEQIEESIKKDDEKTLKPATSGSVMVTTEEKKEAANASTEIVNESPTADREIPAATSLRRPTIALALGGGGARGAAHIGVIRILKEAGIPIDYIVGNSMGSIVGGLYAAGVPLDDIEKMMMDNSLRKAYTPGMITIKLVTNQFGKVISPFKKHYAGLWTGKKLSQFFDKQLPRGVENVEDTVIPFSAIATNLIDGKAYRISDGKLSMAMRASSTIPPFLQPVAIGDKVYVDGGMRANLPASAARETGADIVIAVLVDEPLREVPAKRFRHLDAIVQRMGDVMLAVADARQLPFADIIINPDVSGLPILNGTADDARRAIAAGETSTRKALPDIQKRISAKDRRNTLSADKVPQTLK